MSCVKPMYAIDTGQINIETGKRILRIISNGAAREFKKNTDLDQEHLFPIPCGRCLGCKMDYSKEWTNRLLCEFQDYDPNSCFFVTLTYDNDNINRLSLACDNETGEVIEGFYSLSKREVQLFMKRLRKHFPDQRIRFYACGEYGGERYRPHYHIILFGLHLPDDDLSLYKRSKLGYPYYTSKCLSLAWPFGFVVVGPVTPETCSYTARYMLKKQKGDDAHVYSDFNLTPPFSLCSRKPGIGAEFYKSHPEIFDRNSPIVLSTERGSRRFFPPRYFERLLEKDRPDKAEQRKIDRKDFAINHQKLIELQTDLDEFDYNDMLETLLDKKAKVLNNYRCLV